MAKVITEMNDTISWPTGRAVRPWLGPLMIIWGGIFIGLAPIGLRFGLSDLGPQAIGLWRYLFALPILFAVILLRYRRLPQRPNIFVVIAGTCFALDIGLWHWSLTFTSVANSTFIVNLGNLGVGLIAWAVMRERPKPSWFPAVIIAFVGAGALSLGGNNLGLETGALAFRGDLLALAAAGFVACYMLVSKLARRSLGGVDTIFWLTAVECVVAVFLVYLFNERYFPESLSGFVAPLFLGVFAHVIGQGLIVTGLGQTPASVAGILVIVQPVVAAIMSWYLFGELLTGLQIGGCMLILIAILLAQSGQTKKINTALVSPND